ncbi:putative methyltransferase PMT25 [Hibiscus syriacus]|uniref:Methyltransferase PMT25 n=1 Tax=Hibiscus syriacus TaxID=106335 RepID=A0A6A3A2H5_HIBSY|nr:putative methyltransferase PMT25 [Hibiscus syriacus]
MALGKYSRVDNNKSSSSSSYCSTVTIVIFMGLCLVGIWMITSSWVVPLQNGDDMAEEKKNQVENQFRPVLMDSKNSGNKPQFEDKPDDLGKDAPQGDSNVSLAKDEGKTNFNAKENNENAEETKLEKSKKDNEQSNPEGGVKNNGSSENPGGQGSENSNDKPYSNENDKKSYSNDSEKKRNESSSWTKGDKVDKNVDKVLDKSSDGQVKNKSSDEVFPSGAQSESSDGQVKKKSSNEVFPSGAQSENSDGQAKEKSSNEVFPSGAQSESSDSQVEKKSSNEVFPSGAQSELLKETKIQNGSFSTQAAESKNEKDAQSSNSSSKEYSWKLCNTTAGPDFIPCLDNCEAIRNLHSTKHYEHRERHCPEASPTCLVPLPEGYKYPIPWPKSRDKIWYRNVPHSQLVKFKGGQNWVEISGNYLTFPGGGTQFRRGALHYIDFIQKSVPDIAWGKHSRVLLDIGCGVASFGGYLFERNVITMSLAPKDEHEAQVQFALERGIPAVSAVMGTKRLPYPSSAFDVIHCARCRVPWHIEGGKLLLELNRLLRPGGFFVWSATPVYRRKGDDAEIWKAMIEQTKSLCWEFLNETKMEPVNKVAIATFRKPKSNDCYEQRPQQVPPLCPESDDPNAAWNVSLQTCMHKVPVDASKRGSKWPEHWPERLEKTPYWLSSSQVGVYSKAAPEDFTADIESWKQVVTKSYMNNMGIDWSSVRNVMDMRAIYGGFAAALKDKNLWVMNVVPIDSPDTLPIIYERGSKEVGISSFLDLHVCFRARIPVSIVSRNVLLIIYFTLLTVLWFSSTRRCNFIALVAEVDRILRPGGKLIARDHVETITKLEDMFRSMHWEVKKKYSQDKEGLICVQKSMWRPTEIETLTYTIA